MHADNVKNKLILSLSSSLSVSYFSNMQKVGKISVFTHEIGVEGFVVKLNKNMLSDCDKFIVFYQKTI